MDKRFFLALVLTAAVVIGIPLLVPGGRPVAGPGADSTLVQGAPGAPGAATAPAPATQAGPATAGATGVATPDSAGATPAPAVRPETTTVATDLATYRFSTRGAAPVSVEMARYRSLRPGDSAQVELARAAEPLLQYRLVVPGDTISLHDVPFTVERGAATAGAPAPVVYRATLDRVQVAIAYAVVPDSYQVRVTTELRGAPARSYLLLDLASGLNSAEAEATEDAKNLAFAYKPTTDDASSIKFASLDPGERELASGPLSWAVLKNKYFVFGLLAPSEGAGFAELQVTGGPRTERAATVASGTVVAPVGTDGTVDFTIYAGPQEWTRLVAVGRDFQDVNPYGGWLQAVVQPFAAIVMRALLGLKAATGLSYGWVLVLFGIGVRLAMWPLNQTSMRAQMRMQRLQPEIQAAQKAYGSDPQRQQQEIMRIYKEHGMSPFSSLAGCLPMLLPMPILFALFWVFQGTIEFRGVSFLWLRDISIHDPYYVMPVLMGLTTFLVSWIGMRGMPPNPQTKILAYVLPLMFTVLFAKMASGLHIYYTVQNLAAVPQQWLISNERRKATPPGGPVVQGSPTPRGGPPPQRGRPPIEERARRRA